MDPISAAAAQAEVTRSPWRSYVLIIAGLFLIGMIAGGWVVQRYGANLAGLTESPQAKAASQRVALPVPVAVSAPAQPSTTMYAPRSNAPTTVSTQMQVATTQAARAEALLVAVAARRALDRGLSLGYIDPLLRERFGASQPNAVQTIIAVSAKPVTLEQLRTRLEVLEPVLTHGGKHPDGFWAGVRRELGQLVVVRDANSSKKLPSEIMARALRLLDSGRIDAAILDVEALNGKKLAARWLDDAHRYNEARRALDVIETAALVETRGATE
jgi:hypothetical protein